MKIEKNSLLLTVLISVLAILSTVSVVGATSTGPTLSLDATTKDVPVGGTVDFIVTLTSPNAGTGVIQWNIADTDPITAKLEGGRLSKIGAISVEIPPSPQTFKLTVAAGNGAVIGREYPVQLIYKGVEFDPYVSIVTATAQAGVIPTPELSPSILTAIGLIGLIGLVRMRRKD